MSFTTAGINPPVCLPVECLCATLVLVCVPLVSFHSCPISTWSLRLSSFVCSRSFHVQSSFYPGIAPKQQRKRYNANESLLISNTSNPSSYTFIRALIHSPTHYVHTQVAHYKRGGQSCDNELPSWAAGSMPCYSCTFSKVAVVITLGWLKGRGWVTAPHPY